MRIEVEIGTLAIDALPEGFSADQLKSAVVDQLSLSLRKAASAPVGAPAAAASRAAPAAETPAMGEQIASRIHNEIARAAQPRSATGYESTIGPAEQGSD